MEHAKPRAQHGFTLIELMIVMVVGAILMAIAIPSYRQHILKVKRADAMTLISSVAQRMERCYTRFNSYANQPVTIPECNFATPFTTSDGTYTVTIARTNANQNYVITATAIGSQVNDTQCLNFSLDQTGTQTVSGTSSPEKCW